MNSLNIAKEVFDIEVKALTNVRDNLTSDFGLAVDTILSTSGRTIICGMGKSGIIGKKIAASFASTGTPSYFMHPGEGFHGDLGMVTPEDIFVAISYSGETEEVIKLMPFLRDNGNYIVSMTCSENSTLARYSNCHLNIKVPVEACPLNLAPTSSTTATLAMGDALTVALMKIRGFQPEHFARFHPGGSLGKKLLRRVKDEMVSDNLPFLSETASFANVINIISSGNLGLAIVKTKNKQIGVITDGDLRRAMEENGNNVFDIIASDIATFNPVSVDANTLVHDAFELMEECRVSALLVLDEKEFAGILKK